MSNGIPSFNAGYGRVQGYGAVAQPQDVRPRPEVQQAAPTRATAPSAAPANGLSQAEQQMIDRYFPPSPALTLRLYGANRSAQQVNPHAVGARLDLRG